MISGLYVGGYWVKAYCGCWG